MLFRLVCSSDLQTANVTFENLNIDASGDNTLQGGDGHAGLETNNDGELTASDANNNGSLTAAGIGGTASDITISGDDVLRR